MMCCLGQWGRSPPGTRTGPIRGERVSFASDAHCTYSLPMRTLLIALLLVPSVAAAQTCYSPSDCVAPLKCTSLTTGVVPGTCTPNGVVPPKVVPVTKPVVPVVKKSSSSALVVSSSSQSSSPSSVSSASSASSFALDPGMFDSLMKTMKGMMDSMISMMNSMMNSLKCMFGGCKA